MPATIYDGNPYAFRGDAIGGIHLTTVSWPNQAFGRSANMRVLTDVAHQIELDADPQLVTVPIVDNANILSEQLRVRSCVPIPHKYARLMLNASLTPRAAYERLKPAILADHNEASCRILLEWLRAAMTEQNGALPFPIKMDRLTAPVDSEDIGILVHSRMELAKRSLPGFGNPQGGLQGLGQIAGAVAQLTQVVTTGQVNTEARATAQKAPSTLFSLGGIQKLLRLCNVVTEQELPPIYTRLANVKPGAQRQAIQFCFQDTGTEFAWESDMVVSQGLANSIVGLQWTNNVNDMSIGVNPFLTGFLLSQTEMSAAIQLANTHDILGAGKGAASLADTEKLAAKEKISIPTNMDQLKLGIKNFIIVVAMLLGTQHGAVEWIQEFHRKLEISGPAILRQILSGDNPHLPAYLLRFLQAKWNRWVCDQMARPEQCLFPTLDAVEQLTLPSDNWKIKLPPTVLARLQPAPSPTPPTTTRNPRSGSAPTADRNAAPASPSLGDVGVPFRNDAFDSRFRTWCDMQGVNAGAVRRRAQTNNIELPKLSNGKERCILFHVRGTCNTKCGRAYDHVHGHSDAKQQALATWCGAHWRLD